MAAGLLAASVADAFMPPVCTCWQLQGSSCWSLSMPLRCRRFNMEVYIDGPPPVKVEIQRPPTTKVEIH